MNNEFATTNVYDTSNDDISTKVEKAKIFLKKLGFELTQFIFVNVSSFYYDYDCKSLCYYNNSNNEEPFQVEMYHLELSLTEDNLNVIKKFFTDSLKDKEKMIIMISDNPVGIYQNSEYEGIFQIIQQMPMIKEDLKITTAKIHLKIRCTTV